MNALNIGQSRFVSPVSEACYLWLLKLDSIWSKLGAVHDQFMKSHGLAQGLNVVPQMTTTFIPITSSFQTLLYFSLLRYKMEIRTALIQKVTIVEYHNDTPLEYILDIYIYIDRGCSLVWNQSPHTFYQIFFTYLSNFKHK